ncbi:MAG TPA: RCC1 domain-containing protein, partial [Myxococcota bacterium]|nr:RCC1 domain-containing protein [Myxococcota bacterium]
ALGVGDTAPRGVAPQQMGDALPTVALGSAGVVRSLALGASFGCVLRDAGQVKCWGANEGGQLGLGDTLSRGDGPASLGDALPASAVW